MDPVINGFPDPLLPDKVGPYQPLEANDLSQTDVIQIMQAQLKEAMPDEPSQRVVMLIQSKHHQYISENTTPQICLRNHVSPGPDGKDHRYLDIYFRITNKRGSVHYEVYPNLPLHSQQRKKK